MLDAGDKVHFRPDDAGNLSPTGPQWNLPDKFIALYLSQALTSGKLSQIPHELPFHSFLLYSTSSRLFCPFPVLSLPFHFISIRVNPTCLNCFMHLVSWNLGWSLYRVYEMRRWDRDSIQGVPSSWSEECWLTADGTDERRERQPWTECWVGVGIVNRGWFWISEDYRKRDEWPRNILSTFWEEGNLLLFNFSL